MNTSKFVIFTDSKAAIAGGALVVAGALALYLRKSRQEPGIESFPGPKPEYLLGNVRQFPSSHWMRAFNTWQEEYGDIVYLRLATTPVLILSSLEDVEELLGKRANIWSGRTGTPMVNDIMDFGWSIVQSQPTPEFYEQRKVFRKVIGPTSVGDYDQLIEKEAESLVLGLASFTGNPLQLIERSVAKVIITVAYGERLFKEKGEELIRVNSEAVDTVTYTFSNIWLPNIIPLTRFLPSWIPGLRFPAVGRKGKTLFREIRYSPFGMVKDAMENGKADFSVISKYLSDSEFSSESLRDAIAMMYFAAVDTTTTAVLTFVCNMLMYPEVQRRIQKELDDVVGRGNSPNIASVQSCRLLQAAWKESLRFTPPVPTSIPHVSSAADHWKGRFIPKGTLILQNINFMLSDPRLWGNDAREFKPERFLPEFNPRASELPDVGSIPFGFGRRICPGRYLAERNGTVFVAAILSVYDIVPPAGEPVPTYVEFTGTQIRYSSLHENQVKGYKELETMYAIAVEFRDFVGVVSQASRSRSEHSDHSSWDYPSG